MARGAAGTTRPPRPRTNRTQAPLKTRHGAAGGSAARTGRGPRSRSSTASRASHQATGLLHLERPARQDRPAPWSHGRAGRAADDHPPLPMGRRRIDRARESLLRVGGSLCPSSSTRPGRNSYSASESAAIVRGDRALPCARQRLERHRLQLPRRQVRPGLRGPRGRPIEERRRRACRGLQHRQPPGLRCSATTIQQKISAAARARARRAPCARASTSRTSTRSAGSTWTSGGNPQYPAGTR